MCTTCGKHRGKHDPRYDTLGRGRGNAGSGRGRQPAPTDLHVHLGGTDPETARAFAEAIYGTRGKKRSRGAKSSNDRGRIEKGRGGRGGRGSDGRGGGQSQQSFIASLLCYGNRRLLHTQCYAHEVSILCYVQGLVFIRVMYTRRNLDHYACSPSFALIIEQVLQVRFLYSINSLPLRGDRDK